MKRHTYNARAGGFILAVAILLGSVAGAMIGQSSVGFLIGLGAGALIALLIWLVDRRR